MTNNKDKTKNSKTLSLKLGTKPLIAPKRNIEAGKTVIVEKKRYKRGPNTDNQSDKLDLRKTNVAKESKSVSDEKTEDHYKSGIILKNLTKDEQKNFKSR